MEHTDISSILTLDIDKVGDFYARDGSVTTGICIRVMEVHDIKVVRFFMTKEILKKYILLKKVRKQQMMLSQFSKHKTGHSPVQHLHEHKNQSKLKLVARGREDELAHQIHYMKVDILMLL